PQSRSPGKDSESPRSLSYNLFPFGPFGRLFLSLPFDLHLRFLFLAFSPFGLPILFVVLGSSGHSGLSIFLLLLVPLSVDPSRIQHGLQIGQLQTSKPGKVLRAVHLRPGPHQLLRQTGRRFPPIRQRRWHAGAETAF
ncbi:hypothetical protein C0991_012000, partial [Blastosporella zonata]